MNYILRKSNKFDYHTNLSAVLYPILDDIRKFNWLISDVEYISWADFKLPINMYDEYFILSADNFIELVKADVQMVWGVLLGIPLDSHIEVNVDELPYADGNGKVWKNGNLQHPKAEIEIICFDSSYTIVKFKDIIISDKFRSYFPEAFELEKFKNKSAPNY